MLIPCLRSVAWPGYKVYFDFSSMNRGRETRRINDDVDASNDIRVEEIHRSMNKVLSSFCIIKFEKLACETIL